MLFKKIFLNSVRTYLAHYLSLLAKPLTGVVALLANTDFCDTKLFNFNFTLKLIIFMKCQFQMQIFCNECLESLVAV